MRHIVRSTLLLAVFFAIDKGLALLRQLIIARQFELSAELDAFNAANNLPDMLFALISGGALAIAFIPVLSQYLEEGGRPAAWDLFSRVTNLAFLVTAAFSVLVAFSAGWLIGGELGIAPGFGASQRQLVVTLMRLNLISTLIFSISGLVMAGLQANQHFLLPAMAPAFYNLGQIFGALILAPKGGLQLGPLTLPGFGMGIFGLMYGVILGAALHLGIQLPGLARYRFRWTAAIGLRHPGMARVLSLMGPRLATMFFIQLLFLARDNLASRLGTGAVSVLTYAWFIMQVPETLIGSALATVLLPTLSEQAARGEWESFERTIHHALRAVLAFALPAAALLAVAIRPLVRILGFDSAGTELVVWATRAYLAGVVGHSLLEVTARAFYAQQNARTPLATAAYRILAFIAFGALLYRPLGTAGIALADTLAISSEVLIQLILLGRRMPTLLRIDRSLLRVALITAGSALLVFALMRLPFASLPLAVGSLALGGVTALPFLWPEVKLLIKL